MNIPTKWQKFLTLQKIPTDLLFFLNQEYTSKTIYPSKDKIFYALEKTDPKNIKVVILGQDPYHNKGEAHGLAFSVQKNTPIPPSLKNIYKEIERDLNIQKDFSQGNLDVWANQGVLLLNTVLTVEENQPGSHRKKGWEEFTDNIIQQISDKNEQIVFLLWGNDAKKKGRNIDRSKHLVLETSHPSPLGAYRGFNGCSHFSQTNHYLKQHNKKEILW